MAIRDQVQWAKCNVFGGKSGTDVRTMNRGEFLPEDLDPHQVEALRTIGAVRAVEFFGQSDEPEPDEPEPDEPETDSGKVNDHDPDGNAPEMPNLGDTVAAWRDYASNPAVDGHLTPEEANGKSKAELINQFRK